MKTLVLSCNTGQGHNAAGQAVTEQFLSRGVECVLLNALSFKSERVSDAVSDVYVKTVTHAPWLFGGLYKAGGVISNDKIKSPIYLANLAYANSLRDYILENRIDAVVTPHLFPAETLTHLRKKRSITAKCYSIATDYTCIPFWEETDMDGYFVPHASLLSEYVSRGLPSERLLPLGIPASARFNVSETQPEAREKLSLPADKRIFLLMTGSMGYGGANDTALELVRLCPDCLVIVMAGRNEELLNRITSLGDPRITALPFTHEVPLYMRAADVVLTKPGGLSTTEAASCAVALVLTDPIPGCEDRNAAFFERNGLALLAHGAVESAGAAAKLMSDAALRERMISAQTRIINPHAARDLVDYVIANS